MKPFALPRLRSLKRAGCTLPLVALLALVGAAPGMAADKPLDRQAVEQIVRDYLIANPEVLVEAMHALETKEQAQSEQAQKTALTANRAALENKGPVGGNPKGDVTLVEFFDYNCGYCKRTHPERVEAVKKDGKVRVVYKEFPILAPSSIEAAKAALAANRQGKYEAFHTALMKHEGRLDSDAIRATARDVGLDIKKLEADMGDAAIQAEIDANIALARELGIRGTPGFVIGDTLVPGAIQTEQFTSYFAAARAAKKADKAG
ncbi:thioredoxin domain-containing protein [Niveispirillum sp. SYP-B3756]|nr:thioredoxin domain-containing protein [Niveispirillum sp. SYP-B3756]